jgi:hypothetical protein
MLRHGYDGIFVGDKFDIPYDLAVFPQVLEGFVGYCFVVDVLAIQTQYA